jgi:DNA-binding transcriptional ArsR family regulator
VRQIEVANVMNEGAGQLPRLTITDPQLMRALAHPARQAILDHLTGSGTVATATECARVAGLSPSATSYHLRELAKLGLVEEAPSRGDGRERVWRGTISGLTVEADREAAPDAQAAAREMADVFLARNEERVRRWRDRSHEEPPEWHRAAVVSESIVALTAEELAELNEAVLALLEPYKRWRRADPPPGARTVAVQYRTVPVD